MKNKKNKKNISIMQLILLILTDPAVQITTPKARKPDKYSPKALDPKSIAIALDVIITSRFNTA